MSLIKSISGIRGTIGGRVNDNLTPLDVVKFASAFGTWLQNEKNKKDLTWFLLWLQRHYRDLELM
jgi:phosphomannomutase